MKIIQMQSVFFYEQNNTLDFDGLSYFLRKKIKEITGFELHSTSLLGVLPKDVPPEVPRLQLNSEDNKLRVIGSLQRLDFFIERRDDQEELEKEMFFSIVDANFEIHQQLAKNITRVGLIVVKTKDEDNPHEYVARTYLNSQNIRDIHELTETNIAYNRQFECDNLKFNCHTTHTSGYDYIRQKSIYIRQIDVSSLPDKIFYLTYNKNAIVKAFSEKLNERE